MGSPTKQNAILVTGASGFIGSHLINTVKDRCIIYALARRSQKDAGIAYHTNIHWIRCDISKKKNLERAINEIAIQGGVDFLFHFAGYYDFTNLDNPEYQRTNVDGTRHLLECAAALNIKRFIFSSSLTVTDYTDPRRVLDEQSPLDATIPYARSKRKAEELIRSFSKTFPCTIVRLAAIFSDWCEYGPLYILLRNWLSGTWKATLIPGKGDTALPYLHISDLCSLMQKIMDRHNHLSQLDVVVASPDGCVSQKELFGIAARYFYGEPLALHPVPIWLATVGVFAMEIIGKITGNPPFERVWMLKYIDLKMRANSAASQEILKWQPVTRYHITRRMLFLIEKMKSNPNLWEERNIAMANKTMEERPGLKIYEVMVDVKNRIVDDHVNHLTNPKNQDQFPHYFILDQETLRIRTNLIYEMMEVVFLNGDRHHILCYANYLARQRSLEGVLSVELRNVLIHTTELLTVALLQEQSLSAYRQRIHDEIELTMQLILDEIEDVYDNLGKNSTKKLASSAREHCIEVKEET